MWERRDLCYRPPDAPWSRTHAQMPLTVDFEAPTPRVFFATRDEQSRSHIGWVDVDFDDTQRPPVAAARPALAPGPLGCFDDHGVYPASLVADDDRLLLYYVGWNPGVRRPLFYASIGLATSDDGGESFTRVSRAPVLARSEHDPCLVTSPCVLRDGDRWRMWYVSGFRWHEDEGGLHSWYHVKYAESDDGLEWRRDGRVCIELLPGERNIARPCVVRDGDRYRMWYSRGTERGYRLGYAESSDGVTWTRMDDRAGLEPSGHGFDAATVCYAWVGRRRNRWHMLYNGDGFGRDGFGMAVGDP